jgi:hypothetical protein
MGPTGEISILMHRGAALHWHTIVGQMIVSLYDKLKVVWQTRDCTEREARRLLEVVVFFQNTEKNVTPECDYCTRRE